MKRHTQTTGVRKWAGEDLLELQGEVLKALDGFFAQYGPCIVKGCEITTNGNRYNVAEGLVVLRGTDQERQITTMIVPFKGAYGVSLPLYLTLACTVRERAYKNAEIKPIAYEYYASGSTVLPQDAVDYLLISETEATRFVDVIQDTTHRFLTDAQRVKWDAKETPQGAESKDAAILLTSKNYAEAKDTEILQTSKAYTDTKNTATLLTAKNYAEAKDAETLQAAKTHADTAVAALVNGSPEALNTLQELANALGNDSNFATTVMQAIGERVLTTTFNAQMAEKANKSGSVAQDFSAKTLQASVIDSTDPNTENYMYIGRGIAFSSAFSDKECVMANFAIGGRDILYGDLNPAYVPRADPTKRYELWHTNNLKTATAITPGLMSAADKAQQDRAAGVVALAGRVSSLGAMSVGMGEWSVGTISNITGGYKITHNLGHMNYIVTASAHSTSTEDRTAVIAGITNTYFEIHMKNGGNRVACDFFFSVITA